MFNSFTDQETSNLAHRVSARVRPTVVLVTYNDPKNGRIVQNIYPVTDASIKRVAHQVKMNHAIIYHRGQPIDLDTFKRLATPKAESEASDGQ